MFKDLTKQNIEGNGDFPLYNPAQIEHMDLGLFKWLNEILNISCTTNKGLLKVPIIWVRSGKIFSNKKRYIRKR